MIPSLSLLYRLDDLVTPAVTIKVIGHQWFWGAPFNEQREWSKQPTPLTWGYKAPDLPDGAERYLNKFAPSTWDVERLTGPQHVRNGPVSLNHQPPPTGGGLGV